MTRTERLGHVLADQGIDCFLAWDARTMGYLAKFFENAHERFLVLAIRNTGDVRLICPALSETQARRIGIDQVESWGDGDDPIAHFTNLAEAWNLRSAVIAVDPAMPARLLLSLQAALPAALFRDGEAVLSSLMAKKDDRELAKLQQAANIADEAWEEVRPQIRAGLTERQVADMLKEAMQRRGGDPQFHIVAAGPNGAEPHHLNDDTVLQAGDAVICDFGCSFQGYQSDITRTIGIGATSERTQHVYSVVHQAFMAARNAIRPGVTGEQIDQAARQVIDDAGFGEYFFHRTGHGIGMSGHEPPNMVKGNTDPLEPGNCFSIEPGIYIAGELGVRIENIVYCTADGGQSFNQEPTATITEI